MARARQIVLAALLAGFAMTASSTEPTMAHVAPVDVDRFMGDWYVIASIPTFLERDAYDAVESYVRRPDGRIQTTFRYRRGSFDAKLRTMHPIGTVRDEGDGAIWGMQFVWPIQAEYVIAYLDADYRTTIVARSKRDYVWIMARTPTLPDGEYDALVERVRALGYDTAKLRRVPQR